MDDLPRLPDETLPVEEACDVHADHSRKHEEEMSKPEDESKGDNILESKSSDIQEAIDTVYRIVTENVINRPGKRR